MVLAYEPQFYFCLVNFTTEGLKEDSVNIGDSFRIGSAKIIATQLRMSCYKLGIKFGRMDIIKQFWLAVALEFILGYYKRAK